MARKSKKGAGGAANAAAAGAGGSGAKPTSTSSAAGAASSTAAAASSSSTKATKLVGNHDNMLWWGVRLACVAAAVQVAYTIRLYAINEYGLVIHEFDPWFNYRATEYLHEHGLKEFFHWYDHRSWYPIGRPVGTTIYPGMQMTSVGIWHFLQWAGYPMLLNDICCYVPAWFGVSASIFVGLLTAECSGSKNAGAFAMLVMSCVPAHTMRSVGGGYDNESIAVTAMSMVFYFWCRALRTDYSWPFGVVAGIAYVYMVAAWGGYVFVINIVGVHAIMLVFLGRFTPKLYWAYTFFYAIGTAGAVQIPVVGWTPLKSLEQLGPFGVFAIMQLLYLCHLVRKWNNIVDQKAVVNLYVRVFAAAGVVGLIAVALLWPTGYFGPLSSRVRGLFVTHTRTGNPLVDSVAEHQPASANAYFQYLHYACYTAPIGYVASFFGLTDAKYFLPLYGGVAYFFANKMVRLVILLGPIASALSGVAIALVLEWVYDQFFAVEVPVDDAEDAGAAAGASSSGSSSPSGAALGSSSRKKAAAAAASSKKKASALGPEVDAMKGQFAVAYEQNGMSRKVLAVFILFLAVSRGQVFFEYCHYMAKAMSNPSIMYNANTRDGTQVLVDDYRDAYFWLRDNTPEDARVMAWWDYGYQISGIANRTCV